MVRPPQTASGVIRYLLISYSYPPVLGGSEIEAQRISQELQKRGHLPKIVCAGGEPMPPLKDWVDPCGLRVRLYGGNWNGRWRHIVFALGAAWTLVKDRRECQVVYFITQGLQLALGAPLARLMRKPIVMKFAGSGHIKVMQNSWLGRMELAFLRRWASRILILNPGMRNEALDVGFEGARITWIPNPVDTDYFRPCAPGERVQLRQSIGMHTDVPLTVFAGRLAPPKELPCLVNAFASVVQEIPDAALALIGDGFLRTQLEQQVSNLNLGRNVRFVGRVDTAGVLKWLQSADVFTLVSSAEGLPCSLLEAMSAELPVVVSDIPAHRQIVEEGIQGVFTKVGDQESIARGLVRLLKDPALRRSMGVEGRRAAQPFSTPRAADCYEALFAECAGG